MNSCQCLGRLIGQRLEPFYKAALRAGVSTKIGNPGAKFVSPAACVCHAVVSLAMPNDERGNGETRCAGRAPRARRHTRGLVGNRW